MRGRWDLRIRPAQGAEKEKRRQIRSPWEARIEQHAKQQKKKKKKNTKNNTSKKGLPTLLHANYTRAKDGKHCLDLLETRFRESEEGKRGFNFARSLQGPLKNP